MKSAREKLDEVVDMYSPFNFEDLRKVEKLDISANLWSEEQEILDPDGGWDEYWKSGTCV
jgi:hypothetical protein